MNLKEYFNEIYIQEVSIEDEFVLVISLATPNGGKAGVVSEVSRATAAKMIVDKTARLATPEETEEIRERQLEAKRQKDTAVIQARLRLAVQAEDELHTLKEALQEAQKGL